MFTHRRDIQVLLPRGLSVAKAFLTLEEASSFWFEQLDGGFVLAELTQATDADASLHAELGVAQAQAEGEGNAGLAQLAANLQHIIDPAAVPVA